MELLRVVYHQYRWPFLAVMALTLASAALGIGIIAFINQHLMAAAAENPLAILPQFLALLGILMAVTLGSQLALTTLGHHFVYRLRGQLVKSILDTNIERIEHLGSASLLASLSSDIRNITMAFVRLPELVQGVVLTIGCAAYLGWLSPAMLAVTAVWVAITILVSWLLVSRVYRHLTQVREAEELLYQDYQAAIDGRKELALNRDRAQRLYQQTYRANSDEYRHHIIRADTFHLSAVNWSNIMMLGAIGLVVLYGEWPGMVRYGGGCDLFADAVVFTYAVATGGGGIPDAAWRRSGVQKSEVAQVGGVSATLYADGRHALANAGAAQCVIPLCGG